MAYREDCAGGYIATNKMTPSELAAKIVQACEDTKGQDVLVLDTSGRSDLANYFVIVSGRSDRQVQGIAHRINAMLEENGQEPLSIEGLDQGHWVLLDCEDVVVHVFYEPVRAKYDLEGLWHRAKRVDSQALLAA